MNIFQDIYLHDPSVRWETIIGLDSAKRTIKEAVVYPIRVRVQFIVDNKQKSLAVSVVSSIVYWHFIAMESVTSIRSTRYRKNVVS